MRNAPVPPIRWNGLVPARSLTTNLPLTKRIMPGPRASRRPVPFDPHEPYPLDFSLVSLCLPFLAAPRRLRSCGVVPGGRTASGGSRLAAAAEASGGGRKGATAAGREQRASAAACRQGAVAAIRGSQRRRRPQAHTRTKKPLLMF
jgi:hypothetical protein